MLAIDLGTTGVKVAVVDAEGLALGAAGETLPLLSVADGGVEQDADGWWQAIGRCARRVLVSVPAARAEVGLIAVTSQYNSTVAVDARGLPVANAVM
ncbi:MAG TPA: FGGY family carbohydrate kinase [Ilumatobacteraceae bacterium]|nr:FGGY family carbohydrate kinase [Ilumatobacteraceae bacterium]